MFSFYRDFPGILIVLILKTSGMGKWYSWDFDCLILCAAFDCLITILPCVPPSPIYRQDVMTYIWNAALIAPFRGYMEDEDQVTYVYCASWEVFRVMQSFGVALQTALALPAACNVGQARASAVASTPARRFCATRPCTLCFLGHVP